MQYDHSGFHRALEISAISLFGVFAVALAWRISNTLEQAISWAVLLAAIAIGYVFADLLSGTAHWLADHYGSENTPLVGRNFIRPFREHHADPQAIAHHGFIETNGSTCIVSAPLMGVALLSLPETPESILSTFLLDMALAFCLAVFGTNQFHKWAHMDRAPRLVRTLWHSRLILSPRHHEIHHTAPHDSYYCITTGWWNPLLQRLRFFERLEAAIGTFGQRHSSAE